jgi:hypothetical protein
MVSHSKSFFSIWGSLHRRIFAVAKPLPRDRVTTVGCGHRWHPGILGWFAAGICQAVPCIIYYTFAGRKNRRDCWLHFRSLNDFLATGCMWNDWWLVHHFHVQTWCVGLISSVMRFLGKWCKSWCKWPKLGCMMARSVMQAEASLRPCLEHVYTAAWTSGTLWVQSPDYWPQIRNWL